MTVTSAESVDHLPGELRRRLIRKSDLVANEVAFIDYRIPGCTPKFNYALIGPGVAQGTRQLVNLAEPHGFNLGAVNVPHGVTNPLHLHFTAEVFICYRGDWALTWGEEPGNEAHLAEGDLVSVPPWLYRSFRNVGVDDGFLFAVLGRDDPGGILWAPSVVAAAQAHGLYLTADDRIIDVAAGEQVAPTDRLFEPMSAADMAALKKYSVADLGRCVVRHCALAWSARALLGAIDAGVELAPALGYGITEDRDHSPPVAGAPGFSIEWLRLAPGATVPRHRLSAKQVFINKTGRLELALDEGAAATVPLAEWDTFSIPAGRWRALRNTGSTETLTLVVTPGDAPQRIEWSDAAVDAAARAGWALDAEGMIAPRRFIDRGRPERRR